MCETSNSLCAYHSRRASKGRYAGGQPWFCRLLQRRVGGKVHETGEISITDDGSLMYFVYQVKNGPSNYDNGIGFARRKRR